MKRGEQKSRTVGDTSQLSSKFLKPGPINKREKKLHHRLAILAMGTVVRAISGALLRCQERGIFRNVLQECSAGPFGAILSLHCEWLMRMANNCALHRCATLGQMLLSRVADRGRSRLGHLSQPRIFHGGNQGMLSLSNCSLPAEMQMCSQWRGFNLWRGKEGKDRASKQRQTYSLFSPEPLVSQRAGAKCVCFKGNWAQMLGYLWRGEGRMG